jgi:MFS transporter, NNP family, nitrate/nitrite transporter
MGLSRQYTGTFAWGFAGFAVCALVVLALLRAMQTRWTRTWAGRGGRARSPGGQQGIAGSVPGGAADAA